MRLIAYFILALLAALILATFCFADPYRRGPVRQPVYRDHVRKVIIAYDPSLYLYDANAKDYWQFYGPLPPTKGVALGIDAQGQEMYADPSGKVQTRRSSGVKALADEDASNDVGKPIDGYESGRQVKTAPTSIRLTSLTQSCASCHTKGSERGEFVLFDRPGTLAPGVDWKRVLTQITPNKEGKVRMPPPSAKRSAPSLADVQEIRRLTGG